MRWFPFFILGYVATGLQLGLRGFIEIHDAEPNLILLAAVFVAVNAQRNSALLGCVLLGLVQDLLTPQSPMGLNAFAYGVVAVFIVSTQEIAFSATSRLILNVRPNTTAMTTG